MGHVQTKSSLSFHLSFVPHPKYVPMPLCCKCTDVFKGNSLFFSMPALFPSLVSPNLNNSKGGKLLVEPHYGPQTPATALADPQTQIQSSKLSSLSTSDPAA